jgi:hypothetical protein
MRDHPGIVLTRHFFTSLFDRGFLSDDGVESLKRALLGSLAVVIAAGLLLTRVFMAKYAGLSAGSAEDYAREVVADHAFLIAIPMWCVAAAVGLVGHSLFPDRTDFRILMAEPLSSRTIFTAKLASLLLFVSLVVAAAHLALVPLTALTLSGAMKAGSVVSAAMAFAGASLSGSLFAALAVVAVQGLLVLFAPRRRVLAFSGAVRSVLVGVLVLSLPLVARLPATAAAFASNAWWLGWAPPAWFAGLERWLLGEGGRAVMAAEAAVATVLVSILSVSSYLILYRRFDQVMLEPAASRNEPPRRRPMHRWVGRAPVQHAIRRFVGLTLRRSILHQGLVVGLLAAAGAFVLNSLLAADGWNEPVDLGRRSPFLMTILWAPMAMMFLTIPAVRLALSIPLDVRSNWVFRMAEDAAGRAESAAANVRVVLALGVAVPLAVLGPVQGWVLGPAAVGLLAIEALIGWLAVEWLMADWRRIPFTCSYIPGKGFVPHTFVKGFASYLVFTTLTMLLLRVALARPWFLLVFALAAGAAAGALRAQRRRDAPLTPLMFDDELPTDVNPLRLNAD